MIMMPYGRCRSSLQLTGTQTSDTPQVLVIISVTTDSKIPPAAAAVAIGSALAAAILISGPVSGAAVDPARALGPMILTGRFTDPVAYRKLGATSRDDAVTKATRVGLLGA